MSGGTVCSGTVRSAPRLRYFQLRLLQLRAAEKTVAHDRISCLNKKDTMLVFIVNAHVGATAINCY